MKGEEEMKGVEGVEGRSGGEEGRTGFSGCAYRRKYIFVYWRSVKLILMQILSHVFIDTTFNTENI